jgi:hypothetical protein
MRQTETEGHLGGTLKASTNRNNVIDREAERDLPSSGDRHRLCVE